MSKSRTTFIDDVDAWTVIKSLINENDWEHLVKHHLESYNDFMKNKIPIIIKQFNPLSIFHGYEEDTNTYNYEIRVEFTDSYFTKPMIYENDGSTKLMYPQEARLRNISYSMPINVDMIVTVVKDPQSEDPTITLKKALKNISIGKIPIMVKSEFCSLYNNPSRKQLNEECKYDIGGYFIVNGNEKVIVGQEKMTENKVHVFVNNKVSSKYSHICDVKSTSLVGFNTPKNVSIKLTARESVSGRTIKIAVPHIKVDLPLFIVFRALGVESDKKILEYILYDINADENYEMVNWLKATVEDGSFILSQEEALEFMLKNGVILGQPKDIKLSRERRLEIFRGMLERDFLPHVGPDFRNKALFIGYMVRKLGMCFFKKLQFEDRDSYCNKRVETSGYLMAVLFRQYFTKLIKDMRNSIMKELNSGPWRNTNQIEDVINGTNLYKILRSTTIESGLKYGLATGNWGIKSTNSKVGIAQVLNRLTYVSTLSHLRRINTPTEKTGKLVAPRKLHHTQWGIVCPSETPEGGSVGLVKNISLGCYITIGSSIEPIIKILNDNGLVAIEEIQDVRSFFGETKVFVNGRWFGIHSDPVKLYRLLKVSKQKAVINIFTSITFNIQTNEIMIFTDAGRCCRPLHIVDDRNIRIRKSHIHRLEDGTFKWKNLLFGSNYDPELGDVVAPESGDDSYRGVIEYIDTEESWHTMIAMRPGDLKNKGIQYNYCEIHPCLILGILGSHIPFCNHNQSPRNTYQSAMGKQAMGIYALNYTKRMDTMGHILNYPQKALVNTRIGRLLPSSEIPNGINVIVAVGSYSGYNQEDSIIFNQSAIDRGLFSSTFYRVYKDDEKKIQSSGQDERFMKPDPKITKGMKPGSYDKLDENGIIRVNTSVDSNDIIIGKVVPMKDKVKTSQVYRDSSTFLRNNESGFIDRNYININGEGHKFCKIRVRSQRTPKIGDKFSSRHGQKGTVGMVYPAEDMPYTRDGIVPDIIINPHAIPSRMTIAQLIECILGKNCALSGAHGDGTPFIDTSVHDIADMLETQGFESYGNEVLYNGFNGRQMETKLFMGPTYYQRLKHMVEDKVHSRSTGPMVLLTRQPAEGRTRDGGLRFGEMERDCMIAHGSLQFLKERTIDVSDNFRVFTCNLCGLISPVNPEKNIFKCKKCDNYTDFSEIRLPYSCKLLIQELESMSIAPRLMVK